MLTEKVNNIRYLVFTAIFVGIIYSLQTILMVIPNVQLTTLLMLVYASTFKFRETVLLIVSYLVLHSLFWGISLYTIPIFIGWMWLPILVNVYKSKLLVVSMFSFLYCWTFFPFVWLLTDYGIVGYMLADIPFELIFFLTNFLTTLWLYEPLSKLLNNYKSHLYIN